MDPSGRVPLDQNQGPGLLSAWKVSSGHVTRHPTFPHTLHANMCLWVVRETTWCIVRTPNPSPLAVDRSLLPAPSTTASRRWSRKAAAPCRPDRTSSRTCAASLGSSLSTRARDQCTPMTTSAFHSTLNYLFLFVVDHAHVRDKTEFHSRSLTDPAGTNSLEKESRGDKNGGGPGFWFLESKDPRALDLLLLLVLLLLLLLLLVYAPAGCCCCYWMWTPQGLH